MLKSVYLSPELEKQVADEAKKNNRSFSYQLREIIKYYFESKPKKSTK